MIYGKPISKKDEFYKEFNNNYKYLLIYPVICKI